MDTNTPALTRREFFAAPVADTALARRGFLSAGLALGVGAALPLDASAADATTGQITCHMLDTYSGRPGGGMKVELSKWVDGKWAIVKSVMTVDSGRTAEPLMAGDAMQTGQYMLEFFHAEYFKARAFLPTPSFYDRVTHFFEVPKTSTRYHITLVGAPWGYTTYRWKE